jgi:MFS family permease
MLDGTMLDGTMLDGTLFAPSQLFANTCPFTLFTLSLSSIFAVAGWATYLKDILDPPLPHAFAVNAVSLLLGVCIGYTACGAMSDILGRRRMMILGGTLMTIFSPIVMVIINETQSIYVGVVVQTSIGLMLSCFGGPMLTWMFESFPPEARLTSMAIAYNVAQSIVGGSSPSLATFLVDHVGTITPGFYVSFMAMLATLGVVFSKEGKYDRDLRLGWLYDGAESGAESGADGGGRRNNSDSDAYADDAVKLLNVQRSTLV